MPRDPTLLPPSASRERPLVTVTDARDAALESLTNALNAGGRPAPGRSVERVVRKKLEATGESFDDCSVQALRGALEQTERMFGLQYLSQAVQRDYRETRDLFLERARSADSAA